MKVMPDEAGFVVEGSELDGWRWNAGDVASEGQDIGGDGVELGEVERERRRRRGAELGIEVGEVDAVVPEMVTELKKTVTGGLCVYIYIHTPPLMILLIFLSVTLLNMKNGRKNRLLNFLLSLI